MNQHGLIDCQLPPETQHHDQRDGDFLTPVKVELPLAWIAVRPQNPDRAASHQ